MFLLQVGLLFCCGKERLGCVGWKTTNRWESAWMPHKTEIATEQPFPLSTWWKTQLEDRQQAEVEEPMHWPSDNIKPTESHHSPSLSFHSCSLLHSLLLSVFLSSCSTWEKKRKPLGQRSEKCQKEKGKKTKERRKSKDKIKDGRQDWR